MDKIFNALASKTRREILAYLSSVELSTSDLAEKFNMSSPAISKHLTILENADLVSRTRRGQYVYYSLNSNNLVNTLTGYVFEICPTAGPLKRASKKKSYKKND